MKRKSMTLFLIFLIMCLIPSLMGKQAVDECIPEEITNPCISNNSVKIIRPIPGHLYLFDLIELPISSPSPIIIGEITCVAEQIPIYPFTVKWDFIDWQYGVYETISENVSTPYWRVTYSNFNFGNLEITASFENTAGTVMSSDTIIAKKFL